MDSNKAGYSSIDAYIATFPDPIQAILQELRATIQAAAPDAREKISYQMPTFDLHGNLVHFAAWKNHIALYPTPAELPPDVEQALAKYERSKGSIHFPIDQPLPLSLIGEIVAARVLQNRQRAEAKAAQKKKKP